jgi:hypothetical protein
VLRRVDEGESAAGPAPGHLTLLGANMVLSGATSGLLRWRGGGSFVEGFAKGAAGGAVIYGGKALVVGRSTAAPFLGRQLAAVGSSAVRNAGAGQGLLAHLTLPFGPFRLHVTSRDSIGAWLSVDVLSVATLAGVLLTYDATVDWAASLRTAAPVVLVSDPEHSLPWNGRQLAGNLLLRQSDRTPQPLTAGSTFAHERAHLLQYDQLALLWSDPAERAILGHWRLTRQLQPHIDLGLNSVVNAGLRLMPLHVNPIEIEASSLAGHR